MSPRREMCGRHAIEFERATPCLLCLSEQLTGRQARTGGQILRRPLPFLDSALRDAPGLAISADEYDDVRHTEPLLAGIGNPAAWPASARDHAVGLRR